MTDTASISALARSTGISFPAASRGRTDSGGASQAPFPEPPFTRANTTPNGTPDRASDKASDRTEPASGPRPPLLSGETQLTAQQAPQDPENPKDPEDPGKQTNDPTGKSGGNDPSNPENLTEEEQKEVRELQKRDREVRAHEQAHKAAGGAHAGSPSFTTVQGPDGRSYAVSGEVKIDTSPVPNNPEATIRKLEQVKRAALAPSNPSSQDRQVAAEAEAKIQQARQEKRENEAEELKKANEKSNGESAGLDPSAPWTSNSGSPGSAGPTQPSGSVASVSPGSLFNLVA